MRARSSAGEGFFGRSTGFGAAALIAGRGRADFLRVSGANVPSRSSRFGLQWAPLSWRTHSLRNSGNEVATIGQQSYSKSYWRMAYSWVAGSRTSPESHP